MELHLIEAKLFGLDIPICVWLQRQENPLSDILLRVISSFGRWDPAYQEGNDTELREIFFLET